MMELSPKPMKMKRSFRDEWVKALLDPEAKQTTGYLERFQVTFDDEGNNPTTEIVGRCCIGVRCNLDVEKGLMSVERNSDNYRAFFRELTGPVEEATTTGMQRSPYDNMTTSVWDNTLTRWGLTDDQQQEMVRMNDTYKMGFAEIANWLNLQEVEEDEVTEVETVEGD